MASQISSTHTHRVPEPGCYVPAITLFDPATDTLSLDAQSAYYTYLASTGLRGLVILGTNAETLLLTREERKTLLQTARAAVPAGFPIIAGVSGHSTAQVLEYIRDAHEAGADFLLLLPCAYFGKQTTPDVVNAFFDQVAAVAPLPIILYNFPAVCNGLDLDSDTIAAIALRHENVVGVKLTCGSVAKIARLAATFPSSRFAVFGGQSDFLLGGLAVGSAGCIAAFANIFPKAVARLYELWAQGKGPEALKLQQQLSLTESPTKAGVAATKFAAGFMTGPRAGVKGNEALWAPRRPYGEVAEGLKERIRKTMGDISLLEDE